MRNIFINRLAHFIVLLALLTLTVSYSNSSHHIRKTIQFAIFDQYNHMFEREVPPDKPVVIVDIDEASLEKMGQWPWPRDVMGQMVANLKALGAKVVTFDAVFSEPDRTSPGLITERLPNDEQFASVKTLIRTLPDNDEVFGHKIDEAGNVVTGFAPAQADETLRNPKVAQRILVRKADRQGFWRFSKHLPGAATNLPSISKGAAGNGSFMAVPEVDGILRKISLVFSGGTVFGEMLYPSLSMEALRVGEFGKKGFIRLEKAEDAGDFEPEYTLEIGAYEGSEFTPKHSIPIDLDGTFFLQFRRISRDEYYVPSYKVLDEAYHDEIRKKVDGKFVLVGSSSEGLKDLRSTPLSLFLPGVELHFNALEQVLGKQYLLRPVFIQGAEAAFIFFTGLGVIVLAPFMGAFALAVICAVLVSAMFALSIYAYVEIGYLFDPLYASMILVTLFIFSSLFTYLRTEAERKQVRDAFGLYISKAYMQELTKNPDKLKLGGEIRDLTVMFSDIRKFTSISEGLTPEELIQLMNDFLTPMSDLVMQNKGTIDKYIGDAMMAFWNAPLDDPQHPRHACIAALGMQAELDPINEQVKAKAEEIGKEPILLKAGIGINSGPCSVGNMGSRQRFAYSALGDAVNVASRLEGQTKAYGVGILIGESTWQHVQDFACLHMDRLRVVGKSKAENIYALLGDDVAAQDEAFIAVRARHDEMMKAYFEGDFKAALKLAKKCKEDQAFDLGVYYEMIMDRIQRFIKHPPEKWDGVFVADSK